MLQKFSTGFDLSLAKPVTVQYSLLWAGPKSVKLFESCSRKGIRHKPWIGMLCSLADVCVAAASQLALIPTRSH